MGSRLWSTFLAGVLVLTATITAAAKDGTKFTPALRSGGGVVAAESPEAAQAGMTILKHGGNAIDAAVATVFGLNAGIPYDCGLGGGGYMVYRSASGTVDSLDFRETAPAAMKPTDLSQNGLNQGETGHLVIGVPGVLKGMKAMLDRYGTMSLPQVLAPAIGYARDGIKVTPSLTAQMAANAPRFALFPAAAQEYLLGGVAPYPPGSTFKAPALASDLQLISDQGVDAFYKGPIAQKLVADMHNATGTLPGDVGLMTMADLAAYSPIWKAPLVNTYRGADIVAMPPSTSGGVATIETLNLLEGFDLHAMGQSSADHLHLLAEAQKIAYADRGAYLGDSAFVNVPVGTLTSKAYAAKRRAEIDINQAKTYSAGPISGATASRAEPVTKREGANTTAISVIDRAGNAVALTCTIEMAFGSAVVAPGTGFMLNGELHDFGSPGTANEPRGGKRPRSSISPTIVVRNGKPILSVAGAGGSFIIMGSIQAVINMVDFGNDVAQAIDAEREDAQLEPIALLLETARVAPGVLAELTRRGHHIASDGEYGPLPHTNATGVDPATCARLGSSDPRDDAYATLVQGDPITGCPVATPRLPPVTADLSPNLPNTGAAAAPWVTAPLLLIVLLGSATLLVGRTRRMP